MATSPGHLQELTVTCSQCGSASMERLGPREYRCNHCGAITVVSQDQADRAAVQGGSQTPIRAAAIDDASRRFENAPGASGAGTVRWWKLALPLVLVAGAVIVYNTEVSSPPVTNSPPATPTVPVSQLSLSATQWSNTGDSQIRSGHYMGLITNKSAWPVEVPRYSMKLYEDGVQGATAYSAVPVPRLMPGEYEPISFAFETPTSEARTEISLPDSANRAHADSTALKLGKQQLVREAGKSGYRMVGVVTNSGGKPVKTSEVMVMLFGAGHHLLGYGVGYTRALRPGEQAVIEIPIPTMSVNAVVSYEYLIDGSPDTGQ